MVPKAAAVGEKPSKMAHKREIEGRILAAARTNTTCFVAYVVTSV
jgi:hypothetical protein